MFKKATNVLISKHMKKTEKVSKNIKETENIARYFVEKVVFKKNKNKGALVVALSGDLGAGKTAFVKAVAKVLGIKKKVNSPTFVILKKYFLKEKTGYKYLFHLDVYRLKNENELRHIGWDEILRNDKHLVFVEWPENVKKAIPKGSKLIKITSDDKEFKHFVFF